MASSIDVAFDFNEGRIFHGRLPESMVSRGQRAFTQQYMSVPYESDNLMDYVERVPEIPIGERVYNLRNNFVSKYGIYPNAIYIHHELYYQLMRNSFPNTTYYNDKVEFMGLQLIPQNDEGISLGIIIKENKGGS